MPGERPKVLITRALPPKVLEAAAEFLDTRVRHETRPLTEEDAAAALREHDAILPTLGDAFTRRAFARAEPIRTRLLANFGVGYNHIDVAAAADHGVHVTNTPGAVTDATADIALTLLLMTARRAAEGERLVRAGSWKGWHPTQMLGTHVTGKTVGIVGMGRIGKAIARRCHFGFGMGVVFHNRSTVTDHDIPGALQLPLHAVLEAADFVVLAVPGGSETHHLIDADALGAMKPTAYLVNISRGDVVDEAALIAALTQGRLAGAGLDVYEHEPAVPKALRQLDNVTLLPHLGTAALEVREAMGLMAVENLRAWVEGRELPNAVRA